MITEKETSPTLSKICVICKRNFEEYGNNAQPIVEGRCCDNCNAMVVTLRFNLQASIEKLIDETVPHSWLDSIMEPMLKNRGKHSGRDVENLCERIKQELKEKLRGLRE